MIKKKFWKSTFGAFIFTFLACQGGSDQIFLAPGNYENGGVFVSCQGLFNSTSGTITHYDPQSKTVSQEIYKSANAGEELGNIVQSMIVVWPKSYIVVNNANRLVIVNASNFVNERNIENLSQPRYIHEVTESKFYISQWGSDGATGSIAVFDAIDQTISAEIPLRNGPEKMLTMDGKVYVTNSGGFARDSVVHLIDTDLDTHEKDIVVGDNPISLVQDSNNDIWVLCKGFTDWNEPSNSTPGKLVKLVDQVVATSFDVPNGADNLSVNLAKNKLFFTAEGKIFKHDISSSSFEADFIVESSFFGLNIDPKEGLIYAADAVDFNSQGRVVIYDENGGELGTFATGIIPQDIHFE
jgi:hypothetical protein